MTGTGWCYNANGDVEHFKHGVIDTTGMEGFNRIQHILQQIHANTNIYDPIDLFTAKTTLVVIEDFSFASKGASLFQIAGLGYIFRYELWQVGVNFLLVPPPVLKKFATGMGNADKNIILKEIYKRWKEDINDDNAGDAYVLTRIGRAVIGWDTELTSYQKDVVNKVKELNKW